MSMEQVNINIMRRQLTINTPSDEKKALMQAVELLNEKIEAIQKSGRVVDTERVLIMAALNVVHDLLNTPLKDDLAIGELERKITDMNRLCEKTLNKTA